MTDDRLVSALAAELSQVRLRHVHAIDRDSTKQRRLRLPELEEMVAVSPWSGEGRAEAVHHILQASLGYVTDSRTQKALRVLFDLDHQSRTSKDSSDQAAEILRVPPYAAEETRKLAFRDAREVFARAILVARERMFFSRPADDLLDAEDDQLPHSVLAPLVELRTLTQGRGVSADRIDREAPYICALPGTHDQYRRGTFESLSVAAVAFIECASNQPDMQRQRSGMLASAVLNLARRPVGYQERRSRWIDQELDEDADFDELERRALIRLAVVMSTLNDSPCAGDDRQKEARALAEAILTLLLGGKDPDLVGAYVVAGLEERLPSVARGGTEPERSARWPIQDWFSWLTESVEVELHHFYLQYREYVNGVDELVPSSRVLAYLDDAVRYRDDPFAWKLESDRWIERYFAEADLATKLHSTDPKKVWGKAVYYWDIALRNSLSLVAQLLAYNEIAAYWPMVTEISSGDADYVPRYPMIPVNELKPAPARRLS